MIERRASDSSAVCWPAASVGKLTAAAVLLLIPVPDQCKCNSPLARSPRSGADKVNVTRTAFSSGAGSKLQEAFSGYRYRNCVPVPTDTDEAPFLQGSRKVMDCKSRKC